MSQITEKPDSESADEPDAAPARRWRARSERRERRVRKDSPWHAMLYAQRVSWLGAMACALVLELSNLIGEGGRWWESTFVTGLSYVADSIVVWLILMVLIGITNRVTLSLGIVVVLTVVVAIANRVKLRLRAEPIYPSDVDFVKEPEFLLSQVSPAFLVLALLALLSIVVIAWLLGRRYEPRLTPIWPRHLSPMKQLGAVVARALVLTLVIALLVDTTRFNDPGNAWRGFYEVGGDRWRYWNQRTNYLANGFVGGFLYNMPTVAMEEPPDYNEETMDALAQRYVRATAKVNEQRTGSLADTNVVVILSESFSDPTRLNGYELAEDPIPHTRKRMEKTTSGTMMPQLYGGGTANMEFEALTGQSIGLFNPQLSSPYQMLVPGFERYPSAVGWFAAQGHKPIAIHPYMTGMYKRKEVYQTLGFADFIHDTTMTETEKIEDNEFISDESAFNEVRKQIRDSEDPLMVNLVTMQNHIPVDGNYSDPYEVTGVDVDEAQRIGNYARGLNYTDKALLQFLHSLRKSDEKTVVIFYGDHLPGIYDSDVSDQNPDLGMYQTPFFIWSTEGDASPAKYGLTSPIYFLPMLYEMVDAPIPPYYLLLQRLQRHIAALEQGRMYTPDDVKITEDDLDEAGKKILADARLVQYDFSIGGRYSVDQMWPGAMRP